MVYDPRCYGLWCHFTASEGNTKNVLFIIKLTNVVMFSFIFICLSVYIMERFR